MFLRILKKRKIKYDTHGLFFSCVIVLLGDVIALVPHHVFLGIDSLPFELYVSSIILHLSCMRRHSSYTRVTCVIQHVRTMLNDE